MHANTKINPIYVYDEMVEGSPNPILDVYRRKPCGLMIFFDVGLNPHTEKIFEQLILEVIQFTLLYVEKND